MILKENLDYLLVQARYPKIANMIELHWGTDTFDPMLLDLMQDTKDGQRQGFPVDVGSALMRLSVHHSVLYPHL